MRSTRWCGVFLLIGMVCWTSAGAQVDEPEWRRFYASPTAVMARVRQKAQQVLTPGERQALEGALLALKVNHGSAGYDKGSTDLCGSLQVLAYTRNAEVTRKDGLDGVIEFCTFNLYWAAQTVSALYLTVLAAGPDGMSAAHWMGFKGLLKEQAMRLAQRNFVGQHQTACPPIYVAYSLLRVQSYQGCGVVGNAQVTYNEAVLFWARKLNQRLMREGGKASDQLNEDVMLLADGLRRLEDQIALTIFDMVALHELGHLVKAHHRLPAGAGTDAQAFARELDADEFVLRWSPQDDLQGLLSGVVTLGLAMYVGGHQDLAGSGTKLIEARLANQRYACSAYRTIKKLTGSEGDAAMKALLAQMDVPSVCR